MFAVRRSVVGVLAALAVALVVAPSAEAVDPPVVVTFAATDVTTTTATFHGQVTTGGAPTTASFAYGPAPDQLTTKTPEAPVGAGAGPVPVDVAATGLAANTTYWVAIVAENDDWVVIGDPVQVKTAAPPPAPEILSGTVTDVTAGSATLHLNVATHGQATTISGSFGRNAIRGILPRPRPGVSATAPVRVTNGTPFGPIAVAADGDVAIPLTGMDSGASYYWTARATSAAGSGENGGGPFVTVRLPSTPRPRITPASVPYGGHVTITGTWANAGRVVTLYQQAFPFTGAIAPLSGVTTTTDAAGAYSFDVRVERPMAYGVGVEGPSILTSRNVTRVRVGAVVAAKLRRARHHRFAVSGRYQPGVQGRVTLYRLGAGRVGDSRSSRTGSFAFPARVLKPGRYEVRVTPDDSAGYLPGKSAAITVPRR